MTTAATGSLSSYPSAMEISAGWSAAAQYITAQRESERMLARNCATADAGARTGIANVLEHLTDRLIDDRDAAPGDEVV